MGYVETGYDVWMGHRSMGRSGESVVMVFGVCIRKHDVDETLHRGCVGFRCIAFVDANPCHGYARYFPGNDVNFHEQIELFLGNCPFFFLSIRPAWISTGTHRGSLIACMSNIYRKLDTRCALSTTSQ